MTTGASETDSLMPTATRADARWYAKLILGDDVFISYARRDGADYVLALANRLVSEGLSCFVDQFEGESGTN
jgi:alkylation response protein AidB-like acyl-CoA dehydrogenase